MKQREEVQAKEIQELKKAALTRREPTVAGGSQFPLVVLMGVLLLTFFVLAFNPSFPEAWFGFV